MSLAWQCCVISVRVLKGWTFLQSAYSDIVLTVGVLAYLDLVHSRLDPRFTREYLIDLHHRH